MSENALVAIVLTILVCGLLAAGGVAYGVFWLLGKWYDHLLRVRISRGSWQDDTDEL